MSELAQQFKRNTDLADSKRTHLAYFPKHTGSMDEIRPPRPDERGATNRSRNLSWIEIAAVALIAAIALVVILNFYLFHGAPSNRQTIEAIDVNALVERLIEDESTGIENKKNQLSRPTGVGQFLDDT